MSNKTANARAARTLGEDVRTYVGNAVSDIIDTRGFTKITAAWAPESSAKDVARFSRVAGLDSTAHLSTGTLDLMSVTGSSAGSAGSTAIDWPFVLVTAATSGSSGINLYVAMS